MTQALDRVTVVRASARKAERSYDLAILVSVGLLAAAVILAICATSNMASIAPINPDLVLAYP